MVRPSLLAGIALQSNVSTPYKKNEPWNASPSIGAELDTSAWITVRISVVTTGPRHETGGACTTGGGATWDERCTGLFGAADTRASRGTYPRSLQTPHDARTQCKHEHDGEDDDVSSGVVTCAGRRSRGRGLTRIPAVGADGDVGMWEVRPLESRVRC
jgi:hypothetical protein